MFYSVVISSWVLCHSLLPAHLCSSVVSSPVLLPPNTCLTSVSLALPVPVSLHLHSPPYLVNLLVSLVCIWASLLSSCACSSVLVHSWFVPSGFLFCPRFCSSGSPSSVLCCLLFLDSRFWISKDFSSVKLAFRVSAFRCLFLTVNKTSCFGWRCLEVSLWISSGVTLTNVGPQSRTVVTGLSVTPPPSLLPPDMTVRSLNVMWAWYDTYCRNTNMLGRLTCIPVPLFYPVDWAGA